MQHRAAQQFVLQRIHQRPQLCPALADPGRQRRPRDRQTGPSEDLLLPIQRQVIGVLGHQHLRQQPRRGDALVDHRGRHRRLDERAAVAAGPFATDVTLDGEDARRVVELLGDVFTDALERRTAAAVGDVGFVADLAPRQMGR